MSEDLKNYINRAFNQLSATTPARKSDGKPVRILKLSNDKEHNGWLYQPKDMGNTTIDYAFAFPTVKDGDKHITIAFYFGTVTHRNDSYELHQYVGVTLVYNRSDLSLDRERSETALYFNDKSKGIVSPPVPAGIPPAMANSILYSMWAANVGLELLKQFSLSTDWTAAVLGLEAFAEVVAATTSLAVTYYVQDKGSDVMKDAIKAAQANVAPVWDAFEDANWSSEFDGNAYETKSHSIKVRIWKPTFTTDGTTTLFVAYFDRVVSVGPDDHMIVSFEMNDESIVDLYTVADIRTDNERFTVSVDAVDSDVFDKWSRDLKAKVAKLSSTSQHFAKAVIDAVSLVISAIS